MLGIIPRHRPEVPGGIGVLYEAVLFGSEIECSAVLKYANYIAVAFEAYLAAEEPGSLVQYAYSAGGAYPEGTAVVAEDGIDVRHPILHIFPVIVADAPAAAVDSVEPVLEGTHPDEVPFGE